MPETDPEHRKYSVQFPKCPDLVLQNDGRAPVLVYSHDTMIAINRKECMQIDVEMA